MAMGPPMVAPNCWRDESGFTRVTLLSALRTMLNGLVASRPWLRKNPNALPWSSPRVRLACAWPIMIGVDTLAKLRTGTVLNPATRIKISRGDVKKIMFRSVLLYPFPGAWRKMV